MHNNKGKNLWSVVVMLLIILIAIVILGKFNGVLEKSDILNFYSNLLVVIITVSLGLITYEQTQRMQEESTKENEYLKKLNEESNETNKKLLKIIERNTELEEQKNMPCIDLKYSFGDKVYRKREKTIKLKFKNIGNTVIKYIDIDEIPEAIIKENIKKILTNGIEKALENFTKALRNLCEKSMEKTDFMKFFSHNIDMIGIKEGFSINIEPKRIESEKDENLYVIALDMKIESIYGKMYKERIVILLQKEIEKNFYIIKGKYVEIKMDREKI